MIPRNVTETLLAAIHQTNYKTGSGFPPTSGQILSTFNWLHWNSHLVYTGIDNWEGTFVMTYYDCSIWPA